MKYAFWRKLISVWVSEHVGQISSIIWNEIYPMSITFSIYVQILLLLASFWVQMKEMDPSPRPPNTHTHDPVRCSDLSQVPYRVGLWMNSQSFEVFTCPRPSSFTVYCALSLSIIFYILWMKHATASEGCSALFKGHYAVRIWGKFRQAGLISAGLVGKHRVFTGGTGGAACVWKTGWVLVQTDWQVQIFLNRISRNTK